jgi:hypothetical protein
MFLCKFVDILSRALPLRRLQDLLLRHHVRGYPRCESHLVSREEAGFYLSSETDFPEDPGFTRAVMQKAALRPAVERPKQSERRLIARWAVTAAGLLLIALALLWFSGNRSEILVEHMAQPPERFRINRLIVEGVPADPLIVHPRGSDMVIIWIERHFGSPDRNGEQGGRL